MKKIIMISGLVVLSSCDNDSPKCDESKIIEAVISILKETSVPKISAKNHKIINIITKRNDKELKLCGCQGILEVETPVGISYGSVIYTAEKNSEGEIMVKVEDADF